MRRIPLFLSLILIITACSDGDGATDTTVAAVATTTTTVATTTTAMTTTTEAADPVEFETVAGTPPDVFDSFYATMVISMEIEGLKLEMKADGAWVNGSFDCTLITEADGFEIAQGIIATPETLWFDGGNGYEQTGLFDSGARQVMSTCPTSPLFWANFATADLGNIDGDETTIDGRLAIKTDLTNVIGVAGSFGLIDGFEGSTINEMAMWIDSETGAALALITDVELPSELLGGIAGDTSAGTAKMVMEFSVEQVNDPSLTIDLP